MDDTDCSASRIRHLRLVQDARASARADGALSDPASFVVSTGRDSSTFSSSSLWCRFTGHVLNRAELTRVVTLSAREHLKRQLELAAVAIGVPDSGEGGGYQPLVEDLRLAHFVRRHIRSSDVVGVYSPGSVMLVLSGQGNRGAVTAASRLFSFYSRRDHVRASDRTGALCAGVATLGLDGLSGEELLDAAGQDYQKACESGPGTVGGRTQEREPVASPVTSRRPDSNSACLNELFLHDVIRISLEYAATRLSGTHVDLAHTQRVAEHCVRLARRMGVSLDGQLEVAAAALLRDVGMSLLPLPMLTISGPLQEGAKALVHEHPRRSMRDIRHLVPEAILSAVLHHHEWYDGEGYPERLKGKGIPLPARVLVVVDAFEAMILPRSHRPALTRKRAEEELLSGAGLQFDPLVVRAFLDGPLD